MPTLFRSHGRFAAGLVALFFVFSAAAQETGHLHHVHLNVSDIKRTTDFYRRMFGVVPIQYDGRAPALLLERSFLLMSQKDAASIGNHQRTGLTHFCWGTRDGHQTYDWLKSQGVVLVELVEARSWPEAAWEGRSHGGVPHPAGEDPAAR